MTPFVSRLKGIWKLLLSRNFILIHNIKRTEAGKESTTEVGVHRRTDYTTQQDFLAMKAGIFVAFPESMILPKHEIPIDALDLEVFHIKDNQAYIGYKLNNGNFHYIQVPYSPKVNKPT